MKLAFIGFPGPFRIRVKAEQDGRLLVVIHAVGAVQPEARRAALAHVAFPHAVAFPQGARFREGHHGRPGRSFQGHAGPFHALVVHVPQLAAVFIFVHQVGEEFHRGGERVPLAPQLAVAVQVFMQEAGQVAFRNGGVPYFRDRGVFVDPCLLGRDFLAVQVGFHLLVAFFIHRARSVSVPVHGGLAGAVQVRGRRHDAGGPQAVQLAQGVNVAALLGEVEGAHAEFAASHRKGQDELVVFFRCFQAQFINHEGHIGGDAGVRREEHGEDFTVVLRVFQPFFKVRGEGAAALFHVVAHVGFRVKGVFSQKLFRKFALGGHGFLPQRLFHGDDLRGGGKIGRDRFRLRLGLRFRSYHDGFRFRGNYHGFRLGRSGLGFGLGGNHHPEAPRFWRRVPFCP